MPRLIQLKLMHSKFSERVSKPICKSRIRKAMWILLARQRTNPRLKKFFHREDQPSLALTAPHIERLTASDLYSSSVPPLPDVNKMVMQAALLLAQNWSRYWKSCQELPMSTWGGTACKTELFFLSWASLFTPTTADFSPVITFQFPSFLFPNGLKALISIEQQHQQLFISAFCPIRSPQHRLRQSQQDFCKSKDINSQIPIPNSNGHDDLFVSFSTISNRNVTENYQSLLLVYHSRPKPGIHSHTPAKRWYPMHQSHPTTSTDTSAFTKVTKFNHVCSSVLDYSYHEVPPWF